MPSNLGSYIPNHPLIIITKGCFVRFAVTSIRIMYIFVFIIFIHIKAPISKINKGMKEKKYHPLLLTVSSF